MKPLIGITCSRLVGEAWGLYSRGHFIDYTLNEYSQAIQYVGGAPIIIPVVGRQNILRMILSRVDGLILSGGPDLNPKFYGEQPLVGLGETDEDLDLMELEIARIAIQMDLPIFAICRGIQVLNVSQGGTLYQDISNQVKASINHTQKTDKSVNTHFVQIQKNTSLYHILKRKEIWVNGKHHQAIKDLAQGLIITAQGPDGVIEAVEHPKRKFVLGVQWHPEGTWEGDPNSKRLFRAFIQAAVSYQKKY